jgi:DNA-directed RNA polymerase specialized sigma24 family protein
MRPALRVYPVLPPPPSDHAARVADARVKQALDRWIRGRVRAPDAPDMVQNVLEALLVHAHPPDTVEGLVGLGITMLRHDLVDHYRHRQTVGRVEAGPLDDDQRERVASAVPAEAWDGIDVQRRAHVVRHLVARGKLTDGDVDLLERAEGEGYPAIAAELGITDNALRVRAHRKRAVLREGWARYVAYGLSGVAVFLVVVYAVNRSPERVGRGRISPGTSVARPLPTPRERAARLRASASEACDHARWQDCLDRLDEALPLDPAGDHDPAIQDLRDLARGALQPPQASDKPLGR